MKRTSDELNDIETLKKIQFYAYPAIPVFSAALLAILRDRVSTIWMQNPISVSLLAACIVALVALWVSATTHEFQLWQRYVRYVFIRQQVYAAMVGIAVVLGSLLVFAVAFRVIVFTGFFTVYLLFNIWAQWVTNEHFSRAMLATTSGDLSEKDKELLLVLHRYWLVRPQLARIAGMALASGISFCLALVGEGSDPAAETFTTLAYALAIANILLGEWVIYRWRVLRDNRLQPIIDVEAAA